MLPRIEQQVLTQSFPCGNIVSSRFRHPIHPVERNNRHSNPSLKLINGTALYVLAWSIILNCFNYEMMHTNYCQAKAHDRQFNGLDAHIIRDHTRIIDNLRICVIYDWVTHSITCFLFSSSFFLSLSHLWRFVLIIISWQGLYYIQVIAGNQTSLASKLSLSEVRRAYISTLNCQL